MGRAGFPGEFEQMVLLAILQLEDRAHAPSIAQELEARAGRRVSRGSLYATLERLEKKGWVRWRIVPPAQGRGGYRKRCFTLTADGATALREARDAMARLADGVDERLAELSS